MQFIREQGVTVVHAMPGRANVIAGQTGIFRTYGTTAEQMAVRFPAGILVNLGEVPKSTYPGRLPNTRMGTANLVRTALSQAQAYAQKKAAGKEPPTPNLKLEALDPALERKIPVIFSAHRADDLMTALRLAKEFNLTPDAEPGDRGLPDCRPARRRQGAGDRPSDDAARLDARRRSTATSATPRCSLRRNDAAGDLHRLRGLRPQDARAAVRGRDGRRQRPGPRPRVAQHHAGCREAARHRRPVRQHGAGQDRRSGAVRRRPLRALHPRDAHDPRRPA